MSRHQFGFDTRIADENVVHLSNPDISSAATATLRAYDEGCGLAAEDHYEIGPGCTELIHLENAVGATFGWVDVDSDLPLLVQMRFRRSGEVMAGFFVEETTLELSPDPDPPGGDVDAPGAHPGEGVEPGDGEPGPSSPSRYLLPYTSEDPGSIAETVVYVSNPNPTPALVDGEIFDQGCAAADRIREEIGPNCTIEVRPPHGAYGWIWLDAKQPLVVTSLMVLDGGDRIVGADLVRRPGVSAVPPPTLPPPCGRQLLIDETHDETTLTGGGNSDFLAALTADGYTVNRPGTGAGPLTAARLAGMDCVFISLPKTAFSAGELNALQAYVQAGGGLVLMADHGPPIPSVPSPPWNAPCLAVSNAVGFGVVNNSVSPPGFSSTGSQVIPHAITQGLTSIGVSAATIVWGGDPLYMTPPAVNPGFRQLAGAGLYGQGRVVVIGDATALENSSVNTFDNMTFGLRCVKWVTHCL